MSRSCININKNISVSALNVGNGTGIFKTKSGSTLQFKSVCGSGTTSLSENNNSIIIYNSGGTGGEPAGNDYEIQFNSGGTFAADSKLCYNLTNNAFTAGKRGGTVGDNSVVFGGNVGGFGCNQASGCISTAFGDQTLASGFRSTAFGYSTCAISDYSTAFGFSTTACINSTAFGYQSAACGDCATAFGNQTTANGGNSTAFGFSTTASNGTSTAFGNQTIASGSDSTAFGGDTTASGDDSTAFGRDTTASGGNSTAFGFCTIANDYVEIVLGRCNLSGTGSQISWVETDNLFTIGNGEFESPNNAFQILKNGNTTIDGDLLVCGNISGNTFSGVTDGNGGGTPVGNDYEIQFNSGDTFAASSQLSYITTANTFTAGYRCGTVGDNSVVLGGDSDSFERNQASGCFSAAIGRGAISNGYASMSFGFDTLANDNFSVALGHTAEACFSYSLALGYNTVANADYAVALSLGSANAACSLAFGFNSCANQLNAVAIGYCVEANGCYSAAFGNSTIVCNNNSVAFGFNTIASGDTSVAFGCNSVASAACSTAFGRDTKAQGDISTVFGWNTTTNGYASTAIGCNTTANGNYSIALGSITTTDGDYSIGLGLDVTTCGEISTAFGECTEANDYLETVLGRYNVIGTGSQTIWNETDNLFTIGNGTGATRNNAFQILKNGNTTIDGSLKLTNQIQVSGLTGTAAEGMIRWTGSDFEGYDGSSWLSLTASGGTGSTSPGGTDGQLQYNNGGSFGGSNMIWDDSTCSFLWDGVGDLSAESSKMFKISSNQDYGNDVTFFEFLGNPDGNSYSNILLNYCGSTQEGYMSISEVCGYCCGVNTCLKLTGSNIQLSGNYTQINDILTLNGRSTYPSSPVEGYIIRLNNHSTDSDGLYVYNGTSWQSFATW